MAPKREKMVIRSTKKVVESSVEVSVVGSTSTKRKTRGNKDNIHTTDEEVVSGQEHVKVIPIPIQEVASHAQKDSPISAITTENKGDQENTTNQDYGEGVQTQKEENEEVKKAKKRGRKKRGRKRSEEGYQRYVYKVLKQVHPEMGISSKCMTIVNNLMNDMFERLAFEASRLKDYTGHVTLSSREIQGAVKLVLPGELGKHAIAEGVKAINTYTTYHA
ncbi:histone H2B.1, embryonic [Cajanus cajan]|uniref:Histone H2B 7 n=1 Tax=Cajanus cajan TaxID=3821 RepID=A0A151TNH6_CAJCA|nr:histone H2B.1, embryonic [Cajanus cajan]KYP68614.1 Histone H2B 7 [Cajanus cajan]